MTKKNRLIMLSVCVILFFVITPYIVLYSFGYRVDFKKLKIVATGGIYVKALPQGANIIIDDKINNTTGIFFNTVFVQNLLPETHSIAIKKEGYYNYQKNLEVKENEVTKLEHVILIKQNIPFDLLENNIDYFYTTPDGKNLLVAKINAEKINFEIINLTNKQKQKLLLDVNGKKIYDVVWSEDSTKALVIIDRNYFLLEPFLSKPKITSLPFLLKVTKTSFNQQNSNQIFFIKNKNFYLNTQITPLIKNVANYQIINNTIMWLSYDGFLYNSDMSGTVKNTINLKPLTVKESNDYKIIVNSDIILLKENDSLFLLNQNTKIFENFYNDVNEVKISPDGQKMLFYNDHEILYYLNKEKIFLNRFSEKINDCYWLDSDYLIFNVAGKIIISEIDVRGNINSIELSKTLNLTDEKTIITDNPEIFFNNQDKKLYILTKPFDSAQGKNNLLSSEKLIP